MSNFMRSLDELHEMRTYDWERFRQITGYDSFLLSISGSEAYLISCLMSSPNQKPFQ
jgi:hypothetical protein